MFILTDNDGQNHECKVYKPPNLKTFGKVYELEATDSVITLKYMQYQLHSNREYVKFFVKI
jgi:hypothetical protein